MRCHGTGATPIRATHRKNKLHVTEMQTADFKNFKNVYMRVGPLVNLHKDTNRQPINWMKMKIEYNPNENGQIMCWTSFCQNVTPQHLDLRRKGKGRPPSWIFPQLEDGLRKIPRKNLKDLMDLLPLFQQEAGVSTGASRQKMMFIYMIIPVFDCHV